jgi:hypothetical protein
MTPMSKLSKKKARRRRQRKNRSVLLSTVCSACLAEQTLTPQTALENLAAALNYLEAIGMRPKIRPEFIIAEGERGGGFILPPLGGDPFTVHMVTYNPTARHLSRREDNLDS